MLRSSVVFAGLLVACKGQTCGDTGSGSAFDCGADQSSSTDFYNTAAATATTVDADTCCKEPTCGDTGVANFHGEFEFDCAADQTSSTDFYNTAAATETTLDAATCCKPVTWLATCDDTGSGVAFNCLHGDVNDPAAVNVAITALAEHQWLEQGTCCVKPTCGDTDGAGADFDCAGAGVFNAFSMGCADDMDVATCCVQPTCGSTDGAGTKFDCTGAGVFKTTAEHSTTVDQATCCRPATCGAATAVEVIVTIGRHEPADPQDSKKCVDHSDAAQLSCDQNAAQRGNRVCTDCSDGYCHYGEQFEVSTTSTQVCATRTDDEESWGFALKIRCWKMSAFDCAGDQTSSTDFYITAAATETTVGAATCCIEAPTCGDTGAGSAFDCAADQTSSTDFYNTAAATETTLDAATCCKAPTCGDTGAGSAFDCAGDQTNSTDVYNTAAATETTVDAATCCKVVASATETTSFDAEENPSSFSASGFLTLMACVVIGPICLGLYEFYMRKRKEATNKAAEDEKKASEDAPTQSVTEKLDKQREEVTGVEYLLGLLGYAIGIGNLWRFPFLCGRNGGAAFLVAYFTCLFFVSFPAYMIEMVMGQYARRSTIEFFKSVHPMWQGLGWAQAFMLFFVLAYYNVLLGYTCIYIIGSLSEPFPWAPPIGQEGFGGASSAQYWNEGVLHRFPSEVEGSEGFGPVQWETTTGLLAVWIMVMCALAFGKSVLAKVTWVTVVMPIALLLILLFRAVSLEAADEGVAFYIGKFDGSRLGDIGVWRDACVQILFSLSPGMGTALTMSSFTNKKENVYKTCWIVSLCNSAFSFVGGFAIFSIVGNITYKINYQTLSQLIPKIAGAFAMFETTYGNTEALVVAQEHLATATANLSPSLYNNAELESSVAHFVRKALDTVLTTPVGPGLNDLTLGLNLTLAREQTTLQTLTETARAGPGLAFIAIADGMQTFGEAQNVIAVLFFLTLLTLGLDSTFAWAETWVSYVDDFLFYHNFRWGKPNADGKKTERVPKWVSVVAVSLTLFLVGLPFCTRMGNELLDTVDNFVGLMFLLFGVFIEGIIFVFFFKFDRFELALKTACGHELGPIEKIFWKVTTHFTMPVIPFILFIWGFVQDASRPYGGYPDWMLGIGWFLLVVCLVLIPAGAVKGWVQGEQGILDELPGAELAREAAQEFPRIGCQADVEDGKAANKGADQADAPVAPDGVAANKEESGKVANKEEPI